MHTITLKSSSNLNLIYNSAFSKTGKLWVVLQYNYLQSTWMKWIFNFRMKCFYCLTLDMERSKISHQTANEPSTYWFYPPKMHLSLWTKIVSKCILFQMQGNDSCTDLPWQFPGCDIMVWLQIYLLYLKPVHLLRGLS